MNIRKNGFGCRAVSLLTAFMVMCSCFSVFIGVSMKTSALEDIEIRSFGASFADGAKLVSGKYVHTPEYSDAGHRYIYRVQYNLSGEGFFDPGEVELRVPGHLIRDRNGNYADECELSIPSKEDVLEYDGDLAEIDTSFVYETDGDDIVIRNFGDGQDRLKAGSTGYIEVGYRMTKQTYYYADMAPTDRFTAELKIYNNETGNVIASAQDDAEEVYMDTSAKLVSTNKRCLNLRAPYTVWQSEWGNAPENSGDYYYLAWELRTYIGPVTQPYTFSIDDVVSEQDAEPIAYKLWGKNTFGTSSYQENLTGERFVRYDYVITRHLKATYDPLDSYKITNKETSSLISKDNVDPVQSVSSTDVFNYVRTSYGGPGTHFYHRKWGNNNWEYRFGYRWEIADYGLQDLRDGTVEYLNGDIKYFVETASYAYSHTLEDGASVADTTKYGKRNVTSVLTDDSFYLNDSIRQTEDLQVIINENERKLTYEDYSIDYVDYSVTMTDAAFNEQDRDFVSVPVQYAPDDIVTIYGKFGSSDQWIQVGTYNYYTKTADFNSSYVVSLTDSRIVFCENCAGYRISVSNPHYSNSIIAYPYCRIKNSAYVMEQVGDESVEKIWLTNVSDYEARDSHERLLHQSRSMARDYIIGVEKINEFNKSVITTRSDPMKRNVTVGWKINLSEYYISNYGIVYIPQDQGTFYDLLPKGCAVDRSTVAVSVGEGNFRFLDRNEYTVTVTDNYNDSGRTLLKVRVKEQFSRAVLTFNTISTWDSIIEYGTVLHNSVAYETGNERITGGRNDNGGDILDSELMRGLDPGCEDDRFIYTEHDSQLRFLVASFTGLYKKVKSVEDTLFSEVTRVRQNSQYSYKLRYSTSAISRAKNMIFFDSLENFVFEGKSSDWHGRLVSVDVGQAEEMGIAPVVYYSSTDDLDIESHHDLDEVVDGEKVWKTAGEFGDISAARAIAVDLRHDAEGNDYILDYRSAVSVIAYMLSPESDETGREDPVCFNNVYMSNTVIDLLDNEQDGFIHQDNTEVHYRVKGDLNIEKLGSETGNPAIKGIEFTLEGVSDYNTEVNITEKTDKKGHISFENIEKGQNYRLYETGGSDDYLPIDHVFAVVIDDSGNVTVDGQPVENGEYFNITDDPRIHTDIEFFKRDISKKQKLIEGTKFLLSGRSVYGNDISVPATSDENGKVVFRNIEKGSDYTLTETRESEGYVKSIVEYKVRVDDNAHFFITSEDDTFTADTELNGTISIYNEPYHSFTLQKEGTIKIDGDALPVSGAEYRFWGTSDYSTDYDFTKTTQSNGRIYFEQLEAGTYHLQETNAPEGYELDTTEYIVEILPTDEITIKAKGGGRIVSRNNMGYFVFTDNEKGTITITKKWIDTPESLAERLANDTKPVIHISTEPKRSEAYFKDSNVLVTVTGSKDNVVYFKPYMGEDAYVYELISSGKAKKIDDNTTDFSIYGWYINNSNAEDHQTVYWWTDAKNAYLTDNSHGMWNGLKNVITIDTRGVNTSKVTDMNNMFKADQRMTYVDISQFDTSNVTRMDCMFEDCFALKELDVSSFKTDKVTSMARMFGWCRAVEELDLSNFETSKVVDMQRMFYECYSLKKLNVKSFVTSEVANMNYMFYLCKLLNELDVSGFDTAKVENMANMFEGCENLTYLNVSGFVTTKANNMSCMFSQCKKLAELDVSNFSTGNVTNMAYMFINCQALTKLDVSKWNTSKVTNMAYLFGAELENYYNNHMSLSDFGQTTDDEGNVIKGLENFDTSLVTNMSGLFYHCDKLPEINVSKWDTSSCKNMANMFDGCSMIVELDLSEWDTSSCENMECMFYRCSKVEELDVSGLDTDKVTTMASMFRCCYKVKKLDVTGFNTGKVTNMGSMFNDCNSLTELDLSNFDTSNVTTFLYMFSNCTVLSTFNLQSFITTSVVDMSCMFNGCYGARELNLSSFDPKNVKSTERMFCNCRGLRKIILGEDFNTNSVIDFSSMFVHCESLKSIDVSHFDTTNAKYFGAMFYNCKSLTELDLSSFDTSKAENMTNMLGSCENLKKVYVSDKWTIPDNVTSDEFFKNCYVISGEKETAYSSSHYSIDYAHVDNAPDDPGYFWYKPAPTTTGSGARTVTKRIFTTSSSAGTAYASTDDNCKLTKLTEDTWEYTFTSIPPDLQFYTWEDELPGYSSENMGEVNHKAVVDGRATIVNVADDYDVPDEHYGSLIVRKLVVRPDGSELTDEQTAKKFSFNLKLFDINNDPVTETMLLGTVAYGRNGASFALAHDESVTITGIPAGYSYRVTETVESGYTSQVSEGEAFGVIPSDDTVSVTFTNTLVDEDLMSFTLKKLVDGNFENADEKYSFLISLRGLHSGKTYSITGDVNRTFTADAQGRAQTELELGQNESVSVELPVGAKYTVTEYGGDYTSAYNITDLSNIPGGIQQSSGSTMNRKNTSLNTALETADEGESVTVTFINTKDARQDLTLIKKVENTASSEQFGFTADFLGLHPLETIDISICDLSGAQLTAFREAADSNGRIEGLRFYLSGDEKIVFGQLPVGARYRISEAASSYRASYKIVALADQSVLESKANDLAEKPLTTGTADENGEYTDEGMNVIHEGSNIEITYTNTKLTHDVTVSKIADFTYSNLSYNERNSMEFRFAVSISGLTPESTYKMRYTDKNTTGIIKEEEFTADSSGNADPEIILKSGMSCRIIDLPENAVYTVKENACRMFVAEYSIQGSNGSVIAKSSDRNQVTNTDLSTAQERVDTNDNDIAIVFRNTYTASDYELPSAGVSDTRIILVASIFGMILFAAVFVIARKRRENCNDP